MCWIVVLQVDPTMTYFFPLALQRKRPFTKKIPVYLNRVPKTFGSNKNSFYAFMFMCYFLMFRSIYLGEFRGIEYIFKYGNFPKARKHTVVSVTNKTWITPFLVMYMHTLLNNS